MVRSKRMTDSISFYDNLFTSSWSRQISELKSDIVLGCKSKNISNHFRMWAALDRRKSHNSIMRSPVPLPGLLQTFLCILNFLALAGRIVKNEMRAKVTVNYYLALKVKWLRKIEK